MTSRKREFDTPNIWFPARFASESILIRYSRRGRALEITAMGDRGFDFLSGQTFRITLHDFLNGLGISVDEAVAESA